MKPIWRFLALFLTTMQPISESRRLLTPEIVGCPGMSQAVERDNAVPRASTSLPPESIFGPHDTGSLTCSRPNSFFGVILLHYTRPGTAYLACCCSHAHVAVWILRPDRASHRRPVATENSCGSGRTVSSSISRFESLAKNHMLKNSLTAL